MKINNNIKKLLPALTIIALMLVFAAMPIFAGEVSSTDVLEAASAAGDMSTSAKAIGASIAVGLAAAAGAVSMGIAIAKAAESIARQPEAESKIRTTLMLGLVFIETAIIYALIVAILIIFVL